MDKLSILEQRIRHRMELTKGQILESHNRAYIDKILIEIDTLTWVLNEISSFGLEDDICGH
jgi:hypothetical protein